MSAEPAFKDGEALDWVEAWGLAPDGSLLTDAPPAFTTQGGYSLEPGDDKKHLLDLVARPSAILRKPALKIGGLDYRPEDDPDSILPVAHKAIAVGLGIGDWGDSGTDRSAKAAALAMGEILDMDLAFEEIYSMLRSGAIAAGEIRDVKTGSGTDPLRVTLWYSEPPAEAPTVAGTALMVARTL